MLIESINHALPKRIGESGRAWEGVQLFGLGLAEGVVIGAGHCDSIVAQ